MAISKRFPITVNDERYHPQVGAVYCSNVGNKFRVVSIEDGLAKVEWLNSRLASPDYYWFGFAAFSSMTVDMGNWPA